MREAHRELRCDRLGELRHGVLRAEQARRLECRVNRVYQCAVDSLKNIRIAHAAVLDAAHIRRRRGRRDRRACALCLLDWPSGLIRAKELLDLFGRTAGWCTCARSEKVRPAGIKRAKRLGELRA